jgi:hypothetical protein
MSKLRDAVERYIRAEFAFRCGPYAYREHVTKWYMEADDALREAATGHRDLREAGISLGCKVEPNKNLKPSQSPRIVMNTPKRVRMMMQ